MDAHSVNPDTTSTRYGVHDLAGDQHGSHDGMEVVARCDTRVSVVRAPGLLDATNADQDKWMAGLGRYFASPGGAHALKRKILVVVEKGDGSDPEHSSQIQECLAACKAQGLLEGYTILPLADAEEKTVQAAQAVITAAERSSLGRRDLFIAVGGRAVTSIVGFAAATYRRSTRWISVATDPLGAVLGCAAACHGTNELLLHHTSLDGAEVHRDVLGFSHLPLATFYDPASLTEPLLQGHDTRTFWAELLRIAVLLGQDSDLFLFVEAHMESMLAGQPQKQVAPTLLATAVDLAAAGSAALPPSPIGGLGSSAARAIRLIKSESKTASSRGADDAGCLAMAVGLMAALSTQKGHLRSADLVRILTLFRRAGMRTYDGELEPSALWESMVLAASTARGAREGALKFLLPGDSGKGAVVEISQADVEAALAVLCDHDGAEKLADGMVTVHTANTAAAQSTSEVGPSDWAVHERAMWEDVRYRVVSVPQLFEKSNPTLIRDHCTAQEVIASKKKILVVVDNFADNIVPLVKGYFDSHGSAIDGFRVLPMRIPSPRKNMDAALAVVDSALEMGLSWRDLVIVVGGGTLMDVVGFASSMLRGGIPYVRIPTTLLGMIDAGVGVKVGVDFGGHKSTIGRYYAPVACLNDPAQFLSTLPPRDLACGLAEAIKMALVKSPRILEIIEQHYRQDGIENMLNTDATRELIHLSIRSMLEELQPNLYEQDLRRLVDFGHEFGHIVETQARFQLPHGECVSIGMAIASSLAHRKGILARSDLERILNCLLDMRLPIFATCHGCCDPDLLSAKISTDVPKHKDSMLYLVVPEAVGRGTFLDRVDDIDAGMLKEALLDLRRHADRHRFAVITFPAAAPGGQARVEPSRAIDCNKANPMKQERYQDGGVKDESGRKKRVMQNGIPNGIHKGNRGFGQAKHPFVIVIDVGATSLRVGVMGPDGRLLRHETTQQPSPSKQRYPHDSLSALQQKLLETLAHEIGTVAARYPDLLLEEVGIALGAVVTCKGVVQDASILWGEPARGYDLAAALQERLPGARLTILNDVSAAAWRYKDEGRFCLITVSSGLGNKVFNANLQGLDRLDLDDAGVGGEMGHVVVEPRAVDVLVQQAISRATSHPDEFQASKVASYANGEAQRINAQHLGMAANEGDGWALRLLQDADVPHCPCGNLADLCAYSSGRAALRRARDLVARREDYGVALDDITDSWLQQAMAAGHPLALQVLRDVTYHVALRILQLAADIGLDKFVIVGGFPSRTAGSEVYLQALRQRLVQLCHTSGFFRGWEEDKIHGLVKAGIDDDNDGLIGMGYFVQHLRSHYTVVEKPVREQALVVKTKRIPGCGAREILVKVVYGGICTTDLQILRHERGLEPVILGHEGVCRVMEVGENVTELKVGEMVVLNPNNPLDDHDKLGHSREGLFQEYIKVGREFLDRSQVLRLGRSTPSPTDTLIEPLSCVVAAQGRIRDRVPGKNVLVVGAGFMGLLFVMVNVKMGARNVFLSNRSKERLDFAVSRGIVEQGKAFVADGSTSASSLVDKVTAGEGVDIVIICVSLGQGVQAAQDAITYVNPGGCVYLFAGFRPGDMLALEGGEGGGVSAKLDAWSVRTGWRTERIQTLSGKCVDISGHRGSRQEDLATAAELVRDEGLFFSKVVSHAISLDMLPESMLTLARDHTIRGVPARRVIVDMEARHSVVEVAEKLPLRHLREAAGRSKDAIGYGNLFRDIGFEGDTSHLGWVHPPTWPEIEASLEGILGVSGLDSKRHVIWVGTGAWTFLVAALKSLMPMGEGGPTLHTCSSLDPQALQDVLLSIDDLSTAVCLGISQSGKTLETVALMNALREHFDNAGLDYRQHFIWLTDTGSKPPHGNEKSGDAVIQSMGVHDWQHVKCVPLTVGNRSGISALFCAPHSMVMFLALIMLLRNDWQAMRHLYQQYLAGRDQVLGGSILSDAYSVAHRGFEHIRLDLDESIAQAVTKLVTQLIEQALGSKQAGFNPRVFVAPISKAAEMATNPEQAAVTLQMPADTPAIVKAMLTMDAVCVFVSLVAYHMRIEFVTHPKVNLYKRRAVELIAADQEAKHDVSYLDASTCDKAVTAYLKREPRTRFVEILCYGQSISACDEVKARVMAGLSQSTPDISIEVYRGEEWNHSRYQAAVQRKDTLYVILVPRSYLDRVEGISEGTIDGNIRLLQAIARATRLINKIKPENDCIALAAAVPGILAM
ncbi:hypothetical protein QBC42DRAFT_328047 [Cladorrhinum samala]|uniref:3-dehydroquinate synthase n=1 Tax=Cladorrhinum samala TaxID=585594 RepID=A0AAV9I497_9PEZI|nr:hypothetical protein QBC42DRAFT_328047 [Cladorrhinum samala]